MTTEFTSNKQERLNALLSSIKLDAKDKYYNRITKPVDEMIFDLVMVLYLNGVIDLPETRAILENKS